MVMDAYSIGESRASPMKPSFRLRLQILAPGILLAGIAALCGAATEQNPADPIARIEGDDIALHGEVNLVRETGRSFAELSSGSEVTVRSGRARIELVGGGEIGVCGPAKFSLLRSGATLTLALDYGRIHARLNAAQPVTVFTPLAVATPVPIAEGADELSLGLEQTGKMCLYAARGAVRVQPQFSEQAILVPQNVEAAFTEGRLESVSQAPHTCACDALAAYATPPAPSVRVEAGVLPAGSGTDGASTEKSADPPPPSAKPATEEPIWKVVMPPLSFDASARGAVQPPKPETILLMREVRVGSGAVFHGTVAPRGAKLPATPASAQRKPKASNPPQEKPSFGARVKNFFRRLFGGKAKS
jgi:hypothetical protein